MISINSIYSINIYMYNTMMCYVDDIDIQFEVNFGLVIFVKFKFNFFFF